MGHNYIYRRYDYKGANYSGITHSLNTVTYLATLFTCFKQTYIAVLYTVLERLVSWNEFNFT